MPIVTEVIITGIPDSAMKIAQDTRSMSDRMFDLRPIYKELQPELVSLQKKYFEEAKFPKKWELKESTIKRKIRAGASNPRKPLVRTGEMQSKVANLRPAPTKTEMSVGTDGWPAVIHHKGVKKGTHKYKNYELPQRQYTGIEDTAVEKFIKKIKEYVYYGKT